MTSNPGGPAEDVKLKYLLKKLVASGEIATTDAPAAVVAVLARQHNEYGRKSQAGVRRAVSVALAELTTETGSLNENLRSTYARPGAEKRKETKPAWQKPGLPSERLVDVIGSETQRAFEAAVEPMRDRALYNEMGVEGPRGVLIHGPTGCGKTLLARAMCGEVGDDQVSYFEISGADLASSADVDSETRSLFADAMAAAPAMVFLDDIDAVTGPTTSSQSSRRFAATLAACLDSLEGSTERVSVVATASSAEAVDGRLRRFGRFERELAIGAPNREARSAILEGKLQVLPAVADDVDIKAIAKMTPGWVGADLGALVAEAGACAVRRRETRICQKDVIAAVDRVQPSFSRNGFAASPGVAWTDVGALADARDELASSILAPIADPEKFRALGVPLPAGILLYGPPGCGKTLLAKAVASESSANFISVKGPELLDKYVGESERAVRSLFSRARASAPCIVFFDEIDALCPRRSGGLSSSMSSPGDSSNAVTDRVVNQLLTELDGLDTRGQVYVVAATNRPELLDPALTRPGRIDKLLFVPLPSPEDRVSILAALTQNKVQLANDVDLQRIARDPRADDFSGADLAALLREAGLAALKDGGAHLCPRHFDAALDRVPPSVSPADALSYSRLHDRMASGKKRSSSNDDASSPENSSKKRPKR